MSGDLFENIANPTVKVGTQKSYAAPLSVVVHVVTIAGILTVPLQVVDVAPRSSILAFLAAAPLPPPMPPPPPPPAPETPDPPPPPSETTRPADIGQKTIQSVSFDPSSVGGIEARDTNGFAGGILGGVLGAPPLPPPPVAPLRVGGVISPPTKVLHVEPIYPLDAAEAGVQGLVILQATIGSGGQITDVEVLRSVPLLDDAALTAVRGWAYTPTLLNGVAVPVVLTVTVNFRLFVPVPTPEDRVAQLRPWWLVDGSDTWLRSSGSQLVWPSLHTMSQPSNRGTRCAGRRTVARAVHPSRGQAILSSRCNVIGPSET
jgi:protein TonB